MYPHTCLRTEVGAVLSRKAIIRNFIICSQTPPHIRHQAQASVFTPVRWRQCVRGVSVIVLLRTPASSHWNLMLTLSHVLKTWHSDLRNESKLSVKVCRWGFHSNKDPPPRPETYDSWLFTTSLTSTAVIPSSYFRNIPRSFILDCLLSLWFITTSFSWFAPKKM